MNDDELRDKISLDELYTRTKDVEDLRLRVYKKILNRAHQKIKYTSRQRDTGHFCFFIVPEFLVGTPRYDSAACIAYVMDKLTQNGFMVKYTHPNLLFISWQHYIPKYQRQNFKKKYGYSIDGFGNQVQDKKKDTKNVDPTNMNALFARKQNVSTTVKKKDDKKYNQVSEYKPTGNLIYNTALLKKIENPNNNK
jgi:hypothetical protein|tara:strand:+ start:3378 stop:3959 length:582 start_codon:yes stop_codon:yes gene_type:complete